MWNKYSCIEMMVACLPIFAHAGTATLEVRTTVSELQCNAEQRTRIRACAKAQEVLGTGPYKTIDLVERRDSDPASSASRYEVHVDPSRQVVVRTLLY